jgi:hypothetical protein
MFFAFVFLKADRGPRCRSTMATFYILLVAGLGIIQRGCVMPGIRALWTLGVTTRRLARETGAGDSKTAF